MADITKIITDIVEEYDELEIKLTLNQCYYQAVTRDHIKNSTQSYKEFSEVWNDMQEEQHEQINQS